MTAENFRWIEIGAGHGEMTEHLLKSGAPVTAVELDPPLVKRLESLAEFQPNLTVVHGDVLNTDLATISAGKRMRIYGNLPYYITSPILHHFFDFAAPDRRNPRGDPVGGRAAADGAPGEQILWLSFRADAVLCAARFGAANSARSVSPSAQRWIPHL